MPARARETHDRVRRVCQVGAAVLALSGAGCVGVAVTTEPRPQPPLSTVTAMDVTAVAPEVELTSPRKAPVPPSASALVLATTVPAPGRPGTVPAAPAVLPPIQRGAASRPGTALALPPALLRAPALPSALPPAPASPAHRTPVRPAQNQPGHSQPAQTQPAQPQPAQTHPAAPRPAQTRPAQTRPAQTRPAQTRPATGLVLRPSTPVSLAIPAIGVRTPLLRLGLSARGAMQTPPKGPHYDEAGWYRYSPTPGSLGPAVIAGHVDSAANGPSVFFRLSELRPRERVMVTRADGSVAVFAVDRVLRFHKAQFPSALVYGNTNRAALRLITCGGRFDRASGHYVDNIVVLASLVGAVRA